MTNWSRSRENRGGRCRMAGKQADISKGGGGCGEYVSSETSSILEESCEELFLMIPTWDRQEENKTMTAEREGHSTRKKRAIHV